MADSVYPLYNRTYALYRLSPLHHGDTPLLDERVLRTHAQRLRNQLRGDTIRGVEVQSVAEGVLPNLGPLEACSWDLVGDEDVWADHQRRLLSPDTSELPLNLTPEKARGVQVTLDYERQSYNALLLRDPDTTSSPDAFTSLPLLMLKMPAPVRDIFLNYLHTAFDAHTAPLRLQSAFLASSLDTYMHRLTAPGSTQTIRDTLRRVSVQLSFPHTPTLLKHIEITISEDDVPHFFTRGKQLVQNVSDTPFLAALSTYLAKHLALSLSHPNIHISKITSGAFTLSTDRIRLLAPTYTETTFHEYQETPDASPTQLAAEDLYAALVREATGTGKFLSEPLLRERHFSTPSSVGNARREAGRKRAMNSTALPNANAKKARARGGGVDEAVDMEA
jgi:hypothetical protein